MNNFAEYITIDKAKELGDSRSKKEILQMAKSNKKCINCGQPSWRLGGCGLCFSCTTGESDASDDYELLESEIK